MKINKFNHVGRPTNKEVKEYKKKKKLKIIGTISIAMILIGAIVIYLNRDYIYLDSLMGNSTSNTMKNVQNSSKYKTIIYNPDSYQDGYYYQTYYNNKTKILDYIFKQTGHGESRYYWTKIQIFSDGKYLKTVTPKTEKLKISEKYLDKTLALKVFITSKVSGNNYIKYLKLNVTNNGLNNNSNNNSNNGSSNNCSVVTNKFIWPIAKDDNGKPLTINISSKYGSRSINSKNKFHYGIDISKGNNPSIIATYDGIVTKIVNYKGNTFKSGREIYGTYIIIQHEYNGEKLFSIYAHMKYNSIPSNIKVGTKIKAGTKIGVMGNTGYSSGTHLHFEIRKNDTLIKTREKNNVNPLDYVDPNNPYPNEELIC